VIILGHPCSVYVIGFKPILWAPRSSLHLFKDGAAQWLMVPDWELRLEGVGSIYGLANYLSIPDWKIYQ